jgi:hypothetical protein
MNFIEAMKKVFNENAIVFRRDEPGYLYNRNGAEVCKIFRINKDYCKETAIYFIDDDFFSNEWEIDND